ncbi:MAG: ATP-dependent RecD-like DNA helicase [Syntrophus sp. PtaU1.Bin208]|nr:MAG: ATP-dependent RecD-like DNA helicase [Syntrophus sp. PtaU1.Bin208]
MNLKVTAGDGRKKVLEGAAVFLFAETGPAKVLAASLDRESCGAIQDIWQLGDFAGRKDQISVIYPGKKAGGIRRIFLIGMGKKEAFSRDIFRGAAAKAGQAARSQRIKDLVVVLDADHLGISWPEAAFAAVEGVMLGLYRFREYKTNIEEDPDLETLTILVPDAQRLDLVKEAAVRAQTISRAVYLTKYHLSETQAAARLKTLLSTPSALRPIAAEKALVWVQEKLSLNLAENQIEALRAAVSHKVLVITGGPGTGKTTIINAILRIFSASGAKILLAAPTGRAAKRMSEATGREAKTIHRLLEYSPQKGGFQKDETSPLDCQALVVDEASMIDLILMHHLLKAIPASATFILVGDGDQLPSVGAGSVLTDVMKSRCIPVVELREIFRQARESSIVLNAHRINRGEIPRLLSTRDGLDDFYFVEQEDPEKVLELIIRLVTERIPQRFGLDPLEDIQVLTPMHRGLVGAANLNSVLQKALNPGEEGLQRGGRFYRVGDKVMQISNNYDREVYNGDIGRIVRLDSELQEATLTFDGREVVYDYADLEEIVPSYAVSVHKSQGAEYPAVVLPLLMQHYLLLQRNLLYTAVTRGKKLVVIVGTKKALAIAVRNDKTRQRFSLLSQRLRMP